MLAIVGGVYLRTDGKVVLDDCMHSALVVLDCLP